jgi:hypothetical protein
MVTNFLFSSIASRLTCSRLRLIWSSSASRTAIR